MKTTRLFLLSLLFGISTAHAFECDGRTHCSQMHSCDEATWFSKNCPNTQMDGDHDGIPCESQWCNSTNRNNHASQPLELSEPPQKVTTTTLPEHTSHSNSEDPISRAVREHSLNVQLMGAGVVVQILPDDNEGGRHQRFMVRTDSGVSVLIAHNIDLASRVDPLRVGARLSFYGEYVWNAKGGVVHWTHHDPAGVHKNGWIKYNGAKYQ